MNINALAYTTQSNCTLIAGTENLALSELFYDYHGNSMSDDTSKGLIEGDTIRCDKIDVTDKVFSVSALEAGVLALVNTINGETFTAIIHAVDQAAQTITFNFNNADKVQYPNISLGSDQIKSICKVKSTGREC